MIKTAAKISLLLFGFLLFLSIDIKGKTIFAHLYKVLAPATQYAQETAEELLERSVAGTRVYSKKLFNNSVPKLKDSVDSKLSSRQKIRGGEPAEKITDDEKEELDQLIKNH